LHLSTKSRRVRAVKRFIPVNSRPDFGHPPETARYRADRPKTRTIQQATRIPSLRRTSTVFTGPRRLKRAAMERASENG